MTDSLTFLPQHFNLFVPTVPSYYNIVRISLFSFTSMQHHKISKDKIFPLFSYASYDEEVCLTYGYKPTLTQNQHQLDIIVIREF